MKKILVIIIIFFLFACSTQDKWMLVAESKLVKVELMKSFSSGYINAHWLMTFEDGSVVRNWDNAYFIGEAYKIYFNERDKKYKAVLSKKPSK